MLRFARDLFESFRKPHTKEVFFRSLRWNRRLVFWYALKLVRPDSKIEPIDRLHRVNQLRKSGEALTFICNHLTYADSHVIEALFIRFGFRDLARHIIHIAGQKTFEWTRRIFTRSMNTIRVYQPKARVDKEVKRKMNLRALKWAAHQQRRGYCVLVFPEGTRTRSHKRFNRTAANPKTTIYFHNSYVVPLVLMGSENIMPVGRVLQNPATVRLRIGEPIDHRQLEESMKKENPGLSEHELRQQLMDFYMKQIEDLLDEDYKPKQ
ncbi:1-acyl-sn-glycerol-3-phosphate acyltransferase [bacterium]|nr:1-acyl-sn-glycerol-3-phosphate acyltransferase [bacterium]MCI0605276.1 1-acyl-sn-glycerol-3-phosphate acyltransferase [bacterium]